MSVDWERYSTADQTRARPGRPERFAVLRLSVSAISAIRDLTVKHEPIFKPNDLPPLVNRAHSGVYGLERGRVEEIGYKERVRLALLDVVGSRWEIDPGAAVQAEITPGVVVLNSGGERESAY
jgi:hypothetical protein